MPSKRVSSACADYVPALCTHRPSLLPIEWLSEAFGLAQRGGQLPLRRRKVVRTRSFRGSKSRNKVSVGEPAEGSLRECHHSQPIVYLPVHRASAGSPVGQGLAPLPGGACRWPTNHSCCFCTI